mmetsp:Transcript_24443/g.43807  ORF Transcript_24443/g.43807 Transcript_24443/m.43807 type:complete len:1643 (+) Transcript_24443:86-5014(+)|eukprot:CAMPEP_0201931320 /NCGR_PEP_ID=MMETSP0903-20130614/27113_1 /ASSEMBLY_ACC=CAM_ASM_000552 /TAXON_ID=420261 /ORGANISM="Thalassiosira antarctica, Strain CCMP982" /LENGTH=1642 /DNA_ID=CAMNT_0048470617 /DNA_START=9 /DNA_END=4937 /DNA_ORIENTATION=-
MSPYPAIRRNGACTGSLWKSHSRVRGSSILSFSSSIPTSNACATKHDTSQRAPGLDSPEAAFSLDVILAEANERQRAHEFCVLVGNTLWSYSDVWAYAKGDPPTSEIRIVGASAWNPPSVTRNPNASQKLASSPSASLSSEAISTPSLMSSKSLDFLIVTYSGTHVRCSAPTPLDKDKWLAALHAGLEGNITENRVETLMVLSKRHQERPTKASYQYQPVSTGKSCRGIRSRTKSDMMVQSAIFSALAAFEAEISFRPFVPPLPRVEVNKVRSDRKISKSSPHSEGDLSTSYIYGGCGSNTDAATCLPTTGYHSPCDDWCAPLSDTHCTACGRYPPEHAMRIDAAPLPEYGMEVRVDLCHDCWIAQGVLQHVRYLGWLYEVEARGRAAIRMAWDEVKDVMARLEWENAGLKGEEPEEDQTQFNGRQHQGAGTAHSSGQLKQDIFLGDSEPPTLEQGISQTALLSPPSDSTLDASSAGALLELVGTENFVAYRLRSNTLDSLCQVLLMRGMRCASDFLESIEECAQAAASSCFYSGEQECADVPGKENDCAKDFFCLKKEAFKVAGDMSAALKLLYEYALPPERRNISLNSHLCCSRLRDNADMLAAILEFFLDLCDEGQMDAVAFFWPQLCHIHMQMLPPRDTEEMIRVELMEDFLLTVATRYSVHLALGLVWGLTADLEESLGSSNCNPLSRRRRFAILRFVSELESLLFDFDGGWGGGGVSLHGMLSPSQHQAALLRDAMCLLQLRRRFGSHYLTRSVRLDKLRVEALKSLGEFPSSTADDAVVRARISKNAAYFSSHITFARKLGDIAEKLRFMELEKRPEALREELKEINASGKILGGDPLNRLCGDGRFQKAVHIPINEGHVFRSKERTPVLLLAELVKDLPETTSKVSESLTTQLFPDIAGMDIVEEKYDNFVLHEREQSPTGRTQSDDHSSQASVSSSSTKNTFCDQGESKNDSSSCPHSPSSLHRARINASTESPGRLSHRVLTLTPRASEATNVTKEGKEMMADMIANLIGNKKNHSLAPPVDDSNSDNVNNNNEEMRLPHQHTGKDNRRDHCRAAIKDVMAQSLPGLKGPDPSLPTPASVVRMSSGIDRDGRKISALGSVFPQSGQAHSSSDFSKSSGIHLTADGQFRRDVLFAIMERGMRGSNVIAKGAATAARRAIQAMDRKRAIALMNESAPDTENLGNDNSNERIAESNLGFIKTTSSDITINATIDEGEVMEALRLLIIQNQVAQENLSLENAVKANETLTSSAEYEADSDTHDRNREGVDAGEVDHRLAGCGHISSSILSALRLWKGGIVSNGELLELVQKDLQFLKQSAVFGSADETKLIEDSAFWGRFSFGERWAEKKARLAASSPYGSLPGWDLIGCIVKSNDDLRQEAFVMQLIGLCEEAFRTAGLDLWVHPYDIVATGLTTGIIECVRNAMSFDSLKKRPGYGTDGLVGHFQRMTEIAADPLKALNEAKQNFVSSVAAYSLMSYLFMFKDRHNGNLLLDTAGHVIHIDFGFVFGIAPGGSFSLEQSTPFKLTDEMLEVMGGLGSPLFSEFVTLFCCGFLALQAHADTFLTVVEVTCRGSNFHCFDGKDPEDVLSKLRERFCPELNKSQTVAYALDLIKFATTSYGTKQYDYFQYLSQGIAT